MNDKIIINICDISRYIQFIFNLFKGDIRMVFCLLAKDSGSSFEVIKFYSAHKYAERFVNITIVIIEGSFFW